MSEYHVRLDASIKSAQKSVRAMKRASPQIFPEWSRPQTAKSNLKRATEELANAERAWKALGNPASQEKEGEGGS